MKIIQYIKTVYQNGQERLKIDRGYGDGGRCENNRDMDE